MSSYDLLIINGIIATDAAVLPANLAIRDGRVAAILGPGERPAAAEVIDATGLHILPGLIDTHVHLRDPGRPEREDFTTGTSAAAAGGVTMIMEMPISEPPVNSGTVLARRAELVQPRALVDFALYGAAGRENIDAIAGQAEAGAVAFKTFLHGAPPGREHEFFGLCCTDDGVLPDIMRAVKATGLRHCFHCENDAMLEHNLAALRAAGRRDPLAHAESRPPVVEDAAVALVLTLAEEIGVKVQVVHLSSARSARMLRDARARGLDVTVETCPQYLFLDIGALPLHGPYAKCNPALRQPDQVSAMWGALHNQTVDVIGSDHSPYVADEKERGRDNIFDTPAGVPGLETTLPLLLTAVSEGRLTLGDLVRLTSRRAAEIFRLPGKGRIALGYDADLTLVDLQARWVFDHTLCMTKARACMRLWDGRAMQGRVVGTLVRGASVYREGAIVAQPGHGRFVRPSAA